MVEKITTPQEAVKVLNDKAFCELSEWHVLEDRRDGVRCTISIEQGDGWPANSFIDITNHDAIGYANHLSGYYSQIEAENERLRVVVEAARDWKECPDHLANVKQSWFWHHYGEYMKAADKKSGDKVESTDS